MKITSLASAVLAAGIVLATTALGATPAIADTGPGEVVAADLAAPPAQPATARMVGVDANLVAGLTVTGAGGRKVTVAAKGERPRSFAPAAGRSAVFRRLTPGRVYTIIVAGTRVGTGVPLAAVGPAYGLTVSTTGTPDEVLLRWSHRPAKAQGPAITYTVTASPVGVIGKSSDAATETTGTTSATVTRMVVDPATRYTFTVTPRNPVSSGHPTSATMTRTLREMTGTTEVPTTPAPAVVVTPAATPPAPASPPPAPGPSTKTIYVCPDGYTETAGGLCQVTLAYTYDSKVYTFHQETTGPAPMLDSYETAVAACPGGYNFEDYGWVKYCRQYGPAPTRTVKDATPDGYTDTGSAWTKKDPAPDGYLDDGAQWVKTAAKVARVVPA